MLPSSLSLSVLHYPGLLSGHPSGESFDFSAVAMEFDCVQSFALFFYGRCDVRSSLKRIEITNFGDNKKRKTGLIA